jgi:biopolymer transport protein ExbD
MATMQLPGKARIYRLFMTFIWSFKRSIARITPKNVQTSVHFTLLCVFLLTTPAIAQKDLSYYLPQNVSYDKQISTPSTVVGHQLGEWHVTHDKLVQYLRKVASESDRIDIETYAHSYEDRPLLLLTITSHDNHNNLSEIREQHLQLTQPNTPIDTDLEKMPAVVWMGYSIHGDESSGANAALAVAYYLAAAQGEKVENLLSNTVILLDPCFNPDGLNRRAWVGVRIDGTWALEQSSGPLQTPLCTCDRLKRFHPYRP